MKDNENRDKVIGRILTLVMIATIIFMICFIASKINEVQQTDHLTEARILFPLVNPYISTNIVGSWGCVVVVETPYGPVKMWCEDYKAALISGAKTKK
jgi:hypothetical protein